MTKAELIAKVAAEAGVTSVSELLQSPEGNQKNKTPEEEIEKLAWLIIEEALDRNPKLKVTDRDKRRAFKILVKKLKEIE